MQLISHSHTTKSAAPRLDFLDQAYQGSPNDFTDLTISCGEANYHAHKPIICNQSKVLKAMLADGNHASELSLHTEEPHVVEAMIQYCYSNSYDVPQPTPTTQSLTESESPLLFHSKVLVLADKYELDSLFTLAASNYIASLTALCSDEFVYDMESWVEVFDSIDIAYKVYGDGRHVLRYKLANVMRNRVAKLQNKVRMTGVGVELVRHVMAYMDQNTPFAMDLLFSFVREGECVEEPA